METGCERHFMQGEKNGSRIYAADEGVTVCSHHPPRGQSQSPARPPRESREVVDPVQTRDESVPVIPASHLAAGEDANDVLMWGVAHGANQCQ